MKRMGRGLVRFLAWGMVVEVLARAASAAPLVNPDFEGGTLDGWTATANQMTLGVTTNDSYNRNRSAAITGAYTSTTLITNSITQVIPCEGGDYLTAEGFLRLAERSGGGAGATGYVRARLNGQFTSSPSNASMTVTVPAVNWQYFQLNAQMKFGVANPGFEQGSNRWYFGLDHMTSSVQSAIVKSGANALKLTGSWTGWSFNQVYQVIRLNAGETVTCRGKMYLEDLRSSGSWIVSGIKLEPIAGGAGWESSLSPAAPKFVWTNLQFTAPITVTTDYVFRCMVAGGSGGGSTGTVYFDDLELWREGTGGVADTTASLTLEYIGSSGASGVSTGKAYFDAITVRGSSYGQQSPSNIFFALSDEARNIATNAALSVPTNVYPALYAYGTPATGEYPSYVEAYVSSWNWPFASFTNQSTNTTTISLTMFGITGSLGYVEFDQFRYVAKNDNQDRGAALQILTNAPYFTLGTKDGRSDEFGNGPFPATVTYVVGTSLTNFPRRIYTGAVGGWPSRVDIVFPENLGAFDDSLFNKYFVVDGIVTNGIETGVKAMKIGFTATDSMNPSITLSALTHELHLGFASPTGCYGLVDYPNLTYQGHNEVNVRAPWTYNLVDDGKGWYFAQAPRGNATIEPMDVHVTDSTGNWVQRMYDQALFNWAHAGAGIASLFDDDNQSRLKGPVSYHIGFRIGHTYNNSYPEVANFRGNGYVRMSDYDGVMAGSFRPLAVDVFSLTKSEDSAMMPRTYSRIVPRTSPTNQPDNSYAQVFGQIHSYPHGHFMGTFRGDMHFSPEEATNGCYFDWEQEVWARKPLVRTNDGPLLAFDQVSMYWRGSTNINDGTEGHDVDAVIVKRANGEWITHQVLNPPDRIYHRTLSRFGSNDVVYLMQQDRGHDSYGFFTESPYDKASTFEITMLNDAGLPMSLDVYEKHTYNEAEDNVNIACAINGDFAVGQSARYAYRYRTLYAPGVTILHPNTTSGDENWSNDTYTIDFYATDGDQMPLVASVYYGNGLDAGWQPIATNIAINTTSWYGSVTWNTAGVATGAYYIKVEARRAGSARVGFDVSNTRLQVGRTAGLRPNGTQVIGYDSNTVVALGYDTGFEAGSTAGWGLSKSVWNVGLDHAAVVIATNPVHSGSYACRMFDDNGWNGWSWNYTWQEVPCKSGETLRVTGRVYIGALQRSGTENVVCGIKMESTNTTGSTSAGVEFTQASATGQWLDVTFDRTAPVDGTDRILVYVAGTDCTTANVYFDSLSVSSTNGVATNAVTFAHWIGASNLNATAHNTLSFDISGSVGGSHASLCVSDAAGLTNKVALSNFLVRIVPTAQRLDLRWTNFPTVNKAQIRSVGLAYAGSTSDVRLANLKSWTAPLHAAAAVRKPPQVDGEGMPYYYPGQIVTNIITLRNLPGPALTGLTVQAVQEYAETVMWWDDTSVDRPAKWSEATRVGDRLCGAFEQVWTNISIASNATLVLTNIYAVPMGKYVTNEGWYAFRNIKARARTHLTMRRANGDNVFDTDNLVVYAMGAETNEPYAPLNLRVGAISGGNYTVAWNAVTGATQYDLLEARNPDFNMPVTNSQTATSKAYSKTNAGVYFYKVRVLTGSGTNIKWSAYSSPISVKPVLPNNPPVVQAQSLTNEEDTAIAVLLTGSDPNCDPLTFAVVSNVSRGTLLGSAPSLMYVPGTNFHGTDNFTFRAHDGTTTSTTAAVTLTILPRNDPPYASGQNVTTPEDASKAIVLTGSDPETNAITFAVVSQPGYGTVTGVAPNVTYTPPLNYNGTTTFSFVTSDGVATSAPGTVTVVVTPVNDAPIAYPQWLTNYEDQCISLVVTGYDPDGDGISVRYVDYTDYCNFSAGNENVTVCPLTNYFGADSFQFAFVDNLVTGAPATVSLTFLAVNDPPVASNQSVSTSPNRNVAITLIASDIDSPVTSLTYSIYSNPSYGSLTGTPPNVTYKPATNFMGTVSFQFRAFDGASNSVPATVTINVSNTAPVSQSQEVTVPRNMSRALRLSATDADGDLVTYAIVTGPSNGVLSGSAPYVSYTPNTNFAGGDSFTFRASDLWAAGVAATVTVSVRDGIYVSVTNVSGTENGSQAFPYNTIGEGIAAASNKADIVVVGSGVYAITQQLNVATAITVWAKCGPTGTVIDGQSTTRCVWISGTGVVDGFTIRSGYRAFMDASPNGAGVYVDRAGLVQNCLIISNRAIGGSGAGVYLDRGGEVLNCVFTTNYAGFHGAGVYLYRGGKVGSSLMYANYATFGGAGVYSKDGYYVPGTGCIVENCTIVKNAGSTSSTNYYGGGLVTDYGGTIRNTIVYMNTIGDPNSQDIWINDNSMQWGRFYNCCSTKANLPGSGNITNDPQFVNAAAADFRLQFTSPCVDSGSHSNYPAFDLDGRARPQEGDRKGFPGVDMGAYERPYEATLFVDDSNTSGVEDGSSFRPYNTIMEAVYASYPFDTIMVASGTYNEAISPYIGKHNLTIKGEAEKAVLTYGAYKVLFPNGSSNIWIEGFTFEGGSAGVSLAGMKDVTFIRNTIRNVSVNNYASPNTRVLFIAGGARAKVVDNIIVNNYGGQGGGGLYVTNSDVCIESNDFINCTAWNSAGGIYAGYSSSGYTCRIKNNYFSGNSADYSGAIDIQGTAITNMLIDHNTILGSGADYQFGGAIRLSMSGGTSTVKVLNNVIKDPITPCCSSSIGIYVTATSDVYVANNILYGGAYGVYGTVATRYEYNDTYLGSVFGVTSGSGNITGNPNFTNPGAGDYTLQTNSPCINAGNPAAQYNDADGSRNDMGVFGGAY